jgi:hypothetical protein
MIFVFYPRVTSLIDTQKSIDEASRYGYGVVVLAVIKARDNLILELVGFVFLYIVLAFGFNFIRFEQQETPIESQESKPIEPKQAIKPKTPKVVKPLTKKTQNIIAVLSASVFMLVFVWQVFSNIPNTTTDFDALPMFLVEQAMKGIIACLIVGIIAYIVAKYR